MINFREGWRGHLWQERFHSFVMDEQHLLAAARYVERNPVRARLCARPQDWPWSSAAAHLKASDDALVSVRPLLELVPNWAAFIGEDEDDRLRGGRTRARPLEHLYGSTTTVKRRRSLGRRPARRSDRHAVTWYALLGQERPRPCSRRRRLPGLSRQIGDEQLCLRRGGDPDPLPARLGCRPQAWHELREQRVARLATTIRAPQRRLRPLPLRSCRHQRFRQLCRLLAALVIELF
jgi:hypothetical protein